MFWGCFIFTIFWGRKLSHRTVQWLHRTSPVYLLTLLNFPALAPALSGQTFGRDAMVRGQGWKRRLLPEEQYLESLPDLFGAFGFDPIINLWAQYSATSKFVIYWFKDSFQRAKAIENPLALMALGVGDTRRKLDLVVKRLHVLGAPKVGCFKVGLLG